MNATETENINTGVDSKIVHTYDDAIARAQFDPDAAETERMDGREQRDVTASDPQDNRVEGPDRATSSAPAESKLGPGDDLRDREFPVPPPIGTGAHKSIVDQDHMAEDESRRGGRLGTRAGDLQPRSDVPSILDQDAVAPDLGQEQR